LEVLNIFSAGAARALVMRVAQRLEVDGAPPPNASYGAVGSMAAQVRSGLPADVVILTDGLIDELIADGLLVPGSRVDLGEVGTGVAVRADAPPPALDDARQLRAALLEADSIVCPDPAVATAGRVLLKVLDKLGIREAVSPRLAYCASGYDAMLQLADGRGERDLGVMQVTEIVANDRIVLAGPLPEAMQEVVVYSAALSSTSADPGRSLAFIRRLTDDAELLRASGFGVGRTAAADEPL